MAKPKKSAPPPSEPRVSAPEALVTGEQEAMYGEARCPACESPDAVVRTIRLDIPYFGEVFETIFLCAHCGFKHADTMLPHRGEPMEYQIVVQEEKDLFVRAVKSSSATVEVPELGLVWEPGPASTAEVTNVEGLLRRFEDAVRRAITLFASTESEARGQKILRKIDAIIDNTQRATVILKDPYGNSLLIDDRGKVKKRTIPAAEVSKMLTGEYVFEIEDGRPTGLRRTAPAKRG